MKRFRIVIFAASVALTAGWPLLAHHSFAAEFDGSKAIRITGALVKIEWTNPHTYFYLEVKDETGNVVNTVTYLERDGTIAAYSGSDCRFGYRGSAFRGRPGVVLSAELALTPDDPVAVKKRLARFAESRKATQPTELPSCGSVFLKPEGDFAGRLIEAAGLKGRRVGAMEVSHKHANFFVNLGGGTAEDALTLVEQAERRVFDTFGVTLTREFEVW
jgi:UDP-N-acetylmuramate dehydrogenase